jgi:transcriptional regulator with XRE-family HTH domain
MTSTNDSETDEKRTERHEHASPAFPSDPTLILSLPEPEVKVLATDGGHPDPDQYRIPTIDELDAMRVGRGLSQKELSRRAGCEDGRFNHILHHDVDPQVSTLRSFLRALKESAPAEQRDLSNKRGPKPKLSTLSDPPQSLDDVRFRHDGGTTTSLPDPVCEFCGEAIRKPAQRCPALDDGRCQP